MRPQTKLFAAKFRRILEVLRLQGLRRKFCTNFTIYAPQNEGFCFKVHTHFGSSLPARFTEKKSRGIASGLGMFVS